MKEQDFNGSEDILSELSDVNPVDVSQMDSPSSPKAQSQLKAILMDSQNQTQNINIGSDKATFDQFSQGSKKQRAGFSKSAMTMAAALVAFMLIAAAVLVSPFGTNSAVAAVNNAAKDARKAGSGQIAVSVEDSYGEAGFTVIYDGADLAISDLSDGQEEFDEQVRFVDGVVYTNMDGEWIGVDVPDEFDGIVENLIGQYFDPANVYEIIEDLSEVEAVGSTTINGKDVEHYTAQVEFSELNLDSLGLTEFSDEFYEGDSAVSPSTEEGMIDLDIYLDNDELYKVDVTAESEGEELLGSLTFTEIGSEQTIETPEGAEVTDPLSIIDEESIESLLGDLDLGPQDISFDDLASA